MELGVAWELHALPWRDPRPGAHTARAALYMTAMQAEAGFACPITMTFAAVPALRAQPELAEHWEPLLTATSYDPRLIPSREKQSALCGMAMTEKQGGSDVRANTTTARALNGGGPGGEYEIVGHKWFCSAPMCDLFLVLAQAEEGLSCFALPRVLADGTRNAFALQRLEERGWMSAKWGVSSNNRKARFYSLTASGRKQLVKETDKWKRLAAAIGRVLGPEEG